MEPLHYLALAGQSFDQSRSALPDAPVVEGADRPHRGHAARTVRGALAHSLYRLGDAVAPQPATPSALRTDPVAA